VFTDAIFDFGRWKRLDAAARRRYWRGKTLGSRISDARADAQAERAEVVGGARERVPRDGVTGRSDADPPGNRCGLVGKNVAALRKSEQVPLEFFRLPIIRVV
jgi:hypothetical protein